MAKFSLLTQGNPKTLKGETLGYLTFILHLAPASLSGWNVCPKATEGCRAACLNTAGRGGIMKAGETSNTIQRARIRKTRWFFQDRDAFMLALVADIEKACRVAERMGFKPVFRLNGTSDIRWERVGVPTGSGEGWDGAHYENVMALFPEVQFYDYTKIGNRKDVPSNYALTFSLAEGNDDDARKVLANGGTVAAVLRDKARVAKAEAEGFLGFPVFNGDESDLRFLDPRGHVVALYAKGKAKRDASGFVRD